MTRQWILALCLVVGCAPSTVAPAGGSAPSPVPLAAPGSALPSAAASAVMQASPTAATKGASTVSGHVYLNQRPCCVPPSKSPLIATKMVLTVLYCPSVPEIVGKEYTISTDLNGRYAIDGFPRETTLKVSVMSRIPLIRQMTIGSSPDTVDLVVDGPPCTQNIICPTTISGAVFDTLGRPLDGVTITGKIVTTEVLGHLLFSANSSDTEVTTTKAGRYAIEDAPSGATIRIIASKPGYTTRQKTIIPRPHQEGPSSSNDLTFGKNVLTGALEPDSAMAAEPALASPGPAP